MSESELPLTSRRGFSLVEMAVAMVFMGILMAGMVRLFAGSTSVMVSGMETMNVQRKSRQGLVQLQEEVLAAGHLYYKRVVAEIDPTSASAQPPLLMQSTGYVPPGGNAAVDELQVVLDLPLNARGTLAAGCTLGAAALQVNMSYGGNLIQAGDILFVQDSNWEVFQVGVAPNPGGAVGFTINIVDAQASLVDAYGNDTNPLVHAMVQKPHLPGAQISVFRPLQVVRYTVVPRNLNPADAAAVVPCLVRQSQPLAGNTGTIFAPGTAAVVAPAQEQILLENVVGFTVDWSLDAGRTWLRAGGAGDSWDSIRTALNQALAASPSPLTKLAGGGTSLADPLWMNYVPVLIQLNVTTRSEVQRTEYARAGAASPVAYRTRRETIMLSPRNFGLGAP